MSAYIEERAHINALVRLALEGPTGVPVNPNNAWHAPYFGEERLDSSRADELGEALIRENVRSINWRYATKRGRPADLRSYAYFGGRRLTVPEALLAIRGYEYQTCEHPGWRRSEVYHFLNDLRATVASRVVGYREANTWSISHDAAPVTA